jgi:hypothetical protein
MFFATLVALGDISQCSISLLWWHVDEKLKVTPNFVPKNVEKKIKLIHSNSTLQ